MTTDLEKEREAIRAAYVTHFGSDAGWRGESGGWFIEGYRAALAAPAAPQEQSTRELSAQERSVLTKALARSTKIVHRPAPQEQPSDDELQEARQRILDAAQWWADQRELGAIPAKNAWAALTLRINAEIALLSRYGAAPQGYALMPLVPTQAINDVLDHEGWTWPDLLAAAEAITEEQYDAISAAPQGGEHAPIGEVLSIEDEDMGVVRVGLYGEPPKIGALVYATPQPAPQAAAAVPESRNE